MVTPMSTHERQSARVLVADGEEKVLRVVSSTLEKAGFEVLTAGNRSAAIEACRKQTRPIQLAIVDTAIPGNGHELVEQLYECQPGIRILFTSVQDEPETIHAVGPSGQPRGFLRKPFRRSQLLGRVLNAIDAPLVATA
ncbi:MAG TPA: response regulator [Bryobacteraceae bacterium]|nr:response regulator [Bryobacteraceae bacterium]